MSKVLTVSQKVNYPRAFSSTKSTQNPDNQVIKNYFEFKGRSPNPEYLDGLKYVPFRSCLLHNNDDKNAAPKLWQVRTKPKYFTHLTKTPYSTITGEIGDESDYTTNDLKAGNNRKIKAVNRFTDMFKDSYRRRKVSVLFYTFTIANEVSIDIRRTMDVLKKRMARNGHNFLGYLWVLEISDTLHIHYHAIVVTSRMNFRGMALPDFLKMDSVWGARTEVEFVKKGLKYYLAKYFYKNQVRITGKRLFSQSITPAAKIMLSNQNNCGISAIITTKKQRWSIN